MDRIALECMYEQIRDNPQSFSRDALIGFALGAWRVIERLEDDLEGCERACEAYQIEAEVAYLDDAHDNN